VSHNISLPRHRYVWVKSHFVTPDHYSEEESIPAVWWGVSVTPNRGLACHVVLEHGAMVVDLPLCGLRWVEPLFEHDLCMDDTMASATWDCYGWNAEIVSCDYLEQMPVTLLSSDHTATSLRGTLWFGIDHKTDGFSMEPAQHKHLWVVAVNTGEFAWLPQDQLLLHDKSFTQVNGVPKVKRQDQIWSME
jgi:hypothetical protein